MAAAGLQRGPHRARRAGRPARGLPGEGHRDRGRRPAGRGPRVRAGPGGPGPDARPDGPGRASWSPCTRPTCSRPVGADVLSDRVHAAGLHRHHRRRLLRRLRQPRDRRPGHARRAGRSARRPGQRPRAGACCPARLHRHHRRRLLRRLRQPRRGARRRGQPPSRSGPSAGDGRRRRSSTITRGSSRLGSTALGSRRAGGRRQQRSPSGCSPAPSGCARPGSAPGLTRVPPAPVIDAAQGDHEQPGGAGEQARLPELRRAGRPVPGRPARARPRASAPSAAAQFSFTPKLQPGDLVANQYEVAGCLAHGGLGWIYLARDKNVSDRWVVLKGLLNTGDEDALAVAIVEQQFLAQVEHPLIVEIYNFVTHDEAGYIVMEYVGGTSLKQILKNRMRANGGQLRPAAGGPGAGLHPRGAARLQLPARPRPGLLRLQARQPDPGRRRGQADRPRRRPPDRRRGVGDLRHGRLPGPRGGRRSAPPSPPTSTRSAARWWC